MEIELLEKNNILHKMVHNRRCTPVVTASASAPGGVTIGPRGGWARVGIERLAIG